MPNTKWPVSAAWMAVMNVSLIAHFAHQHHVGIFADGVLHADLEVDHVQADLALIDQALVFGEDEFDRVFEREDVLAIACD